MKIKTQYSCQNCGHVSAKWLGRCPGCEAWNTLVEERAGGSEDAQSAVRDQFRNWDSVGVSGALVSGTGRDWVALDGSADESGEPITLKARLATGIQELDRVLGGGMMPDGFTLIGGDPGIGKSTLLLQMARGVVQKNAQAKILYVSGEESIDQIRGRAKRLNVESQGRIFLAAETQLERVFATIKELKPTVIVMDSLQTFSSGYLQSAPGSVSQLREVAARLMALAKTAGISIWLVGHVTKEGNIAGPKVVEHMVDTVLYFEGEGGQSYRLLRTVKNRFGSTGELGVFEMDGEGLREVSNPSSLFLTERKEPVAGTATTASVEGTRPLLVELQALVVPSPLAVPRRTAVGMNDSRIALIAAILERHMGLKLADEDLFFNVAGGLRLAEPACDLAAAAAIWSSHEELAFPGDWLFIGELGLTGEVRKVSQMEMRVQEAKKLGFKTLIVPAATSKLSSFKDLKILPIERIAQLKNLMK